MWFFVLILFVVALENAEWRMEILAGTVCVVACFIAWCLVKIKKRRAYLLGKYKSALLVDKLMAQKVWQGMSQEQLIDSLGEPVAKDEKIYKTKTVEVFKYDQNGKNRFRKRVQVENGSVVGWSSRDDD